MATSIIDTFITRYAFQVDQQSARRVNRFVSGLQSRVRALGGALTTLGVAGGLGIAGITQALREYSRVTNTIQNSLLDLTKKQDVAMREAEKGLEKYKDGLEGIDRTIKRVFTQTQHLEGIAALMSGDRSSAAQINKMYKNAVLPTAVSESVTPAQAGASLTNILRAYGLQDTAEQMQHVADVIASFATKHAIPFASMDRILSGLGERSQNAGVSLREMAGILTYLGSEGQDPSRIDTALRAILSRLLTIETQPPTVKQRLNRAGINADDIKRNYFGEGGKGIIPLLRVFRDNNVDSSTLRALMGEEAYVIFGKMVSDVSEIYKALQDSRQYGGGAAGRRAEVMSGGLESSIGGITSSLQDLAIAIGNTGVIQGLTVFADALAWIITKISSIFGAFENTARTVIATLGLGVLGAYFGRNRLHRMAVGVFGRRKETDEFARRIDKQFREAHPWRLGSGRRSKGFFNEHRRKEIAFYDNAIREEVRLRGGSGRRQRRLRNKMWRRISRTPGISPPHVTKGYRNPDYGRPNPDRFVYATNPLREWIGIRQERIRESSRNRIVRRSYLRMRDMWSGIKWGPLKVGPMLYWFRHMLRRLSRLIPSFGLLLTLGLELIPLLISNWRSIIEFFKSPIQNLSRWFESLSGLQAPMKTPEQMMHEKKMREQYPYYDDWKKNMERMGIDRPSHTDTSASLNISIGDIHVATAEGASGEDIATGIRVSLNDQMHSALENFDSMVRV